MKKILFLVATLTLCSCGKSKVETFLREKEPNITTLEIIEESKEDSAYTPYNTLLSLNMEYASIGADISKLREKAMQEESKDKVIMYLDSAINVHKKRSGEISKILFNCHRYISLPSICEEPFNRKFITAKYRLNGKLKEQRFFFNNDGKSIGHTDEDTKALYKEVETTAYGTLNIENEIIKDMRMIRGY
ncbi:hypothetical protein [Bacteroides sp.]|uniref:hypothetical protein n=1 Tax=Bacteroides sp. TaxID=29523 RepID=UPI0025C36F32|nr:hypothetical protein [Bacteroides sp.]